MLDVEAIRRDIPSLRKSIYLNAGGVAPITRAVHERLSYEFTERYLSGSPLNMRPQSLQREKELARGALAAFLGVGADELCFTRGVSDGANIVMMGLPWQAGDEIVLSDEEHPAFLLPALMLKRRQGVVLRFLPLADDAEVMLTRFQALLNPRTRLVALSHVTTDTGVRLPAKEICAVAHRSGVPVYYDGAQAVGQFPVDLKEMGCDFYSVLSYKWLLGPYTAGALYLARDQLRALEVAQTGARAERSIDRETGSFELLDSAQRFEYGPHSWPVYLGMVEAAQYIASLGLEEIESRVRELAAYLRLGLAVIPGVRIVTPAPPELSTGIVTFSLDGIAGDEIAHAFRDRWGIITRSTVIRAGGVRLCVAFFTTREELDVVIEAVACIARGG